MNSILNNIPIFLSVDSGTDGKSGALRVCLVPRIYSATTVIGKNIPTSV